VWQCTVKKALTAKEVNTYGTGVECRLKSDARQNQQLDDDTCRSIQYNPCFNKTISRKRFHN